MTSREIVSRAMTFGNPPRLPFWQHLFADIPDDVCDCWEMDRSKSGWFFDNPVIDDWGCGWEKTEQKNMGQVTHHPLQDWSSLASYRPPDPRDPWYFSRLSDEMSAAGDRYVVVTSHFNLFERAHMLHGFTETLVDLYEEPEKVERLIDLVLEWKLEHLAELHRRFADRVHGIFLTDDWGTQQGALLNPAIFQAFFARRYRTLFDAIHSYGWHAILHSCGFINELLPQLVAAGVDCLNMQQPQCNGIQEVGKICAGKVAFLTTNDIQATLPQGDPQQIRTEAEALIRHWATPQGGFIVFNYGDPEALGVSGHIARLMFDTFAGITYP